MAKRPRADGVATRNGIIEAAGTRIASSGFAQTTSTEIAALAGVDLATINHHFGSRSGLYQAVLAEAHRRFVDAAALEQLAGGGDPPEAKLRALIDLVIGGDAATAHWPMVVLAREFMAPSPHLMPLLAEEILPKVQHLLPIFSALTGLAPDSPRLWRCLPCVIAPCAVFVLARQVDSPLTTRIASGQKDEIVEQLYTFARAGLAAVAKAAD